MVCLKCSAWLRLSDIIEEKRFQHLPEGKPLSGDELKRELQEIITSFIDRTKSLSSLGSSQSNESFNNMVASKAPKNRSYGSTGSLHGRVSAAVLQKNEGSAWISKVNEKCLISPGRATVLYGKRMDNRKRYLYERSVKRKYKRQRLILKQKHRKKEVVNYIKEGTTYETDIGVAADTDIETLPEKKTMIGDKSIVVFDLETTGLGRDSHIIQLEAIDGSTREVFNEYARPRKPISAKAKEITGICYSFERDEMFHHGKKVDVNDVKLSLLKFIEFLQKRNKPILVGHNIQTFDIPILLRHLQEFKLLTEFISHIGGCLDTLKVARKLFKKEVVNFKQETLVHKLLGKTYIAHSAQYDVEALCELYFQQLQAGCGSQDLFPFNMTCLERTYEQLVKNKVLTSCMSKKLARCGLGLRHLNLAYKRDNNYGIKVILKDHGFCGRSAQKLQKYFEEIEE